MKSIVLVCCHKEDIVVKHGNYLPIHVGAAMSNQKLPYQRDDEGDSISSKNSNYCEITGIYWAWKNLKNVDYIGLCHYRRYFDVANKLYFRDRLNCSPNDLSSVVDLNPNLLSDCDIILARPKILPRSLAQDYCRYHIAQDYKILKEIIVDIYPQYNNSFIKVMEQNNKPSLYNMFYTSWSIFDQYCEWLFRILQEAEKRIDTSSYDAVQKRVFGYMAERLLNVFVYHHKFKVKYLPIKIFAEGKNRLLITQIRRDLYDSLRFKFKF